MPALSALLAHTPLEIAGDDRPVARAELGDELHELLILLGLPRTLVHSRSLAAADVVLPRRL